MKYLVLPAAVAGNLLVMACQTQKTLTAAGPAPAPTSAAVWHSDAYTVLRDAVVQGPYRATAASATALTSNYHSPARALSPRIAFKFSLNGKDNELPAGQNHSFVALRGPGAAGTGALETPVIVFGQPGPEAAAVPDGATLAPGTSVKIRLDLRPVLAAFQKDGFYTNFKGEKIYQQDLKHVLVAGDVAPLSWDFDNLVNKPELELHDPNGTGIYETTLVLNAPDAAKTTAQEWHQTIKTDDFPQYSSEYPLADALYNLALEEARRAVEPDSTFRTGKEWAGVWTRDISYSILLAQATLQPRSAMKSLLRKVSPQGRIIQDTGTGGAYPCSTDRVIWAVAAWEIYKVTGDEAWLRKVYPIVQQSIADDVQNAYNPETGLVRGESSFLDWREQTYPRWMQPADIYQSENLGTNAVHAQANTVLAAMARQLGHPEVAAVHERLANQIRHGVNQYLWLEKAGYYGQFRYGRVFGSVSPRAEALGEALSVCFGVADATRAKTVVERTPTVPFGVPCIYPQIPGIPPYHNDAVWPFVQSFWALAAAQTGNDASLTESMAAIYRPAALFLTNKENFVASTGDFAGTQINSSNMLWSLSGSLGLVYKVLFGMHYETDRLVFRPFVPQAFQGPRKLTNFRYRGAVLDVEMNGFGNEIQTITLDGQPLPDAAVPATLTGRHALRIVLRSQAPAAAPVNRVANRFSPETPQVTYAKNRLSWAPVAGAKSYKVLKNAQVITANANPATGWPVPTAAFAEYQVVAVDAQGLESFASEPVAVAGEGVGPQLVPLVTVAPKSKLPYQGFTGAGFVETSTTKNAALAIPVTVPEAGLYALDFRYANGNGPINTENKCAIRTLRSGAGALLGTVVLPQRGTGEWSNWGFTNPLLVRLEKGKNTLRLALEPANTNMNIAVNQAMLDYLRVQRVQ
ncbi:MGH1-like glycoside hydrolase domain-containing protein [Hymenobacter sp. PAMC 26628]|uniref:MGH1-like glycoside hydrolase domain-containing protein n=1 Tax=Hymenobacter sp. PAMC 26628 TaxID=1484118 RepID=UPI00090203DB|nr:family 78 glycoside hydrolase catalytic domain [Hymenobacter sp. PAMC 26628]